MDESKLEKYNFRLVIISGVSVGKSASVGVAGWTNGRRRRMVEGGNAEKEIKEEQFMNEQEGPEFNVFEESDAV